MEERVRQALTQLTEEAVQWDCPLHKYTSFAIGGPAAALVTVQSVVELQRLLLFLHESGLAWRVIGRGTNLLVRDSGFDGVILVLGSRLAGVSRGEEAGNGKVPVRVGAACGLGRLLNWCEEQGLSGLEFAAGIPGTVGGAVVMNAGAWGRDVSGCLGSVTVIEPAGEIKCFRRDELDFGYRVWHDHDRVADKSVVVEVELLLLPADSEAVRQQCQCYRQQRQMKQPKNACNAGSFFKNPPHDAAGRLIEASGLKGLRVGGAMVSPVHANFLVNAGGATAADVLELMERVREKVQRDSGIMLEPEVHFL